MMCEEYFLVQKVLDAVLSLDRLLAAIQKLPLDTIRDLEPAYTDTERLLAELFTLASGQGSLQASPPSEPEALA